MLKLDTVDSTNNYAMRLIDADKAVHGLTIMAEAQTAGKGQRGKSWSGMPGESLMMSIILAPGYALPQQPLFLAKIALCVADAVRHYAPDANVTIKWPNDILIGDKKAAGILIENIVRGQNWQWAIVGIGLNIGQEAFPDSLPHATSLRIATGGLFQPAALAADIRERLLCISGAGGEAVVEAYNQRLYRYGKAQHFKRGADIRQGIICGMNAQGQLLVRLPDGTMQQYTHGSVEWIWAS